MYWVNLKKKKAQKWFYLWFLQFTNTVVRPGLHFTSPQKNCTWRKTSLHQVSPFSSYLPSYCVWFLSPSISSLPPSLPFRNSQKGQPWWRRKGTKMKANRSLKSSTRQTATGKAVLESSTPRSSWCMWVKGAGERGFTTRWPFWWGQLPWPRAESGFLASGLANWRGLYDFLRIKKTLSHSAWPVQSAKA